ncbi:DNase I-like protein [Xylariaceae sp. FL1019]|nr:DNase I-like protein [Xylariaceae sp. FL1019]
MASSNVSFADIDTFILTFNAGKAKINPAVFGQHLYDVFSDRLILPDLVVFCLQEMAPLADAFIGSYMISPYFSKYEQAVNMAAANFVAEQAASPEQIPKEPIFTLVTSRNVGMTGIMLFARDPSALRKTKDTEVGFGAGQMGNKGAVGVRSLFVRQNAKGISKATELTFVATHLQAFEWNLEKRNQNWETIVSGLRKQYIHPPIKFNIWSDPHPRGYARVFDDPKKLRDASSRQPIHQDETETLLSQDDQKAKRHDATIYKPGSRLFLGGDLNYRISTRSPTQDSVFPSLDPESPDYYTRFLSRDQLTSERKAGRTLHGLDEAEITFPPTYKLEMVKEPVGPESQCQEPPHRDVRFSEDPIAWDWAQHRWPSWTDRILYLNAPSWVPPENKIKVQTYSALPAVRTSDHRAVYLRVKIPVIEPAELAPSDAARGQFDTDPRVKLPFSIDSHSWENRKKVKEWEYYVGWLMKVAESKYSIGVVTCMCVLGLGYWCFRSQ